MSVLPKVGIDLVYLPRIAAVYARFGQRFLDRVFTATEQAYCLQSIPHRLARLGGRWAAKEAVVKALGTGWQGYGYTEIEIVASPQGSPQVHLIGDWSLSISHDGDYAIA
ncbi:MAG: holo-ACP synthase, partial [Synechococcaceae cyanobacterium SM2_3_60]|nr:holo-ACP synthase [Synechococcaceae cyanobacterium SM2_3_60]